jgi:hypothetical protein
MGRVGERDIKDGVIRFTGGGAMSAFGNCCKIEAAGMRDLLPFIGERSLNGQFVLTEKGRLSEELQKRFGDVFLNRRDNGHIVAVEVKSEEVFTGNFFLETWSNKSRLTPGWMITNDSDFLFYYFLNLRSLHVIPFDKLKKWFFGDNGRTGSESSYFEVRQRKHDQLNDTWGRIVPIEHVRHRVPMREYLLAESGAWVQFTQESLFGFDALAD